MNRALREDTTVGERSLFSIVRVCLVMIFLCAWVTVHRNIPRQREGLAGALWGRFKILFWVVVAPELVLAWAARQWVAAKEIANLYNRHFRRAEIEWSTVHGHFLIMGGFLLVEPLDSGGKTCVLSFELFRNLVQNNQLEATCNITEITEDEIIDRSKNGGLSRHVTILQMLWFILQCIARYKQDLPMTEFELVALALSSVSGIMYIFWWNKPKEVRVPMKVYLTKALVTDTIPDLPVEAASGDTGTEITEGPREAPRSTPAQQGGAGIVQESVSEKADEQQPTKSIFTFSAKDIRRTSATFLKNLKCIVMDRLWDSKRDGFLARLLGFLGHGIYLLPAYLLFHLFFFPIFILLFIFASISDIINTVNLSTAAERVPTFYAPRTDKERGIQFIVFAIVGIVYGGFHCMAWNFVFPTRADRIFWRTASVAITVLPLLSIVIGLIRELSKRESLAQDRVIEKHIMDIVEVLSSIALIVVFFVHVSARLLLLAQAVWLLREQPVGVYRTVDWTAFIPHLF